MGGEVLDHIVVKEDGAVVVFKGGIEIGVGKCNPRL